MAQHDVVILNEVAVPTPQIQEIQAGDTYKLPADVEIVGDLVISGTVDGQDIVALAAVAASAVQPTGVASIVFTPGAAPAHLRGKVFYDEDEEALSYYTEEADVTLNIGQEMWIRAFNNSGALIENGKVVNITGSTGNNAEITKVKATSNTPRVLGLSTHDIEDQSYGYVTTFGIVRDIDTSAFSEGDSIYLSRDTAGELVSTVSTVPNETLEVGIVITSHASTGKVLVDVENNPSLFPVGKSYNFSARTAASGEYFLGGFYNYAAADANLSDGSPAQTFGGAVGSHAAHAFMVVNAGSTNGTTITVTVTGTSITDAGVRTPADSETLFFGDPATLSVNQYFETAKKWLGTVTYTLTSDGATFALDFNYGFCKYDDFQNVDFTVRAFEIVGLADATDSGFNVQLLHHEATGWTYHATAFVAGNTALKDMNVIHGTEEDLTAGDPFAFKITGINEAVVGGNGEGVLIRVTTSVNNSIAFLNAHIDATIP